MKRNICTAVLLLAALLLLTGCGETWTPLSAEQMDKALCMEDALLQGDTLTDHGVLFDHGSAEQYNGYLDWWSPEVREYVHGLYGDDALALLEQIADDVAKDNDPIASRNTFVRNRFANTAELGDDAYRFILSDLGLFQAYREKTLIELLRSEETAKRMHCIKRGANDPIRVLLTDGSRYIAIHGKGIRSMGGGDDTKEAVGRAETIWSALVSPCEKDFVLVSDPKAADVIVDMYVSYPFGGRYGPEGKSMTTTAFGCSIYLIAVDLSSDAATERGFEVMPEASISVQQISGTAWSDLPDLKGDADAAAFMETICSWYRDA